MKDFRVTVTIRNNRMVKLREELGMNQSELCEAAKLNASKYSRLEALKDSPLNRKTKEWTVTALRVAEFHGVSPGELWPEAILQVVVTKVEREFDAKELLQLAAPAGEPDEVLNRKVLVADSLKVLTERELQVIKSRFWEDKTLGEAGEALEIGVERARQVESKALRKLTSFLQRRTEPPETTSLTTAAFYTLPGVSKVADSEALARWASVARCRGEVTVLWADLGTHTQLAHAVVVTTLVEQLVEAYVRELAKSYWVVSLKGHYDSTGVAESLLGTGWPLWPYVSPADLDIAVKRLIARVTPAPPVVLDPKK